VGLNANYYHTPQTLHDQYIAKAKEVGADAIFFQEIIYFKNSTIVNNTVTAAVDTFFHTKTIRQNGSIEQNPMVKEEKIFLIKYL
jgi:hypothetical protein